jgi:hypothetical protein
MRVGVQGEAPAALPPVKTRYPLYRRPGGSQGTVWTDAENLAPTWIRSPDLQARSVVGIPTELLRPAYIAPVKARPVLWVGPRAAMDTMEIREFFAPEGK